MMSILLSFGLVCLGQITEPLLGAATSSIQTLFTQTTFLCSFARVRVPKLLTTIVLPFVLLAMLLLQATASLVNCLVRTLTWPWRWLRQKCGPPPGQDPTQEILEPSPPRSPRIYAAMSKINAYVNAPVALARKVARFRIWPWRRRLRGFCSRTCAHNKRRRNWIHCRRESVSVARRRRHAWVRYRLNCTCPPDTQPGHHTFQCSLQEVNTHLVLIPKQKAKKVTLNAARFYVPCTVGSTLISALLDSGANVNLINKFFLIELEEKEGISYPRTTSDHIRLVDHQQNPIQSTESVTLPVKVHNRIIHISFLIDQSAAPPASPRDAVLLGAPYITSCSVESFWTATNQLALRLRGEPDTVIMTVKEPTAEAPSPLSEPARAFKIDSTTPPKTRVTLPQTCEITSAQLATPNRPQMNPSTHSSSASSAVPGEKLSPSGGLSDPEQSQEHDEPPTLVKSASTHSRSSDSAEESTPSSPPSSDHADSPGIPENVYEVPSPVPEPADRLPESWNQVFDIKTVPAKHQNFISNFLDQNMKILSLHSSDIGCNTDPSFAFPIEVDDNFRVPRMKPYACSPPQRKFIDEVIERWLEMGVIEPSTSSGCFPLFCVGKKIPAGANKEFDMVLRLRPVIDFRPLNKASRVWPQKIPNIAHQLESLRGKTIFSKFDLTSAYLCLQIQKDHRHLTSFITPSFQVYQFRRMPFGLLNAGTYFQHYLSSILAPLGEHAIVYLDDIVLASSSIAEHEKLLKKFASLLDKYGLKISPKKSTFFQESIEFLGFRVDSKGVHIAEEKTKAVQDFPRPKSVSDAQSFIGLCNFVQKFIPQFQVTAAPITDLFRKDKTFNWTPECESAFLKLKSDITTATSLNHPDFDDEFHLWVDASKLGGGGGLFQFRDDTPEHVRKEENPDPSYFVPVAFHSRKFSPTQVRYSSLEQETITLLDCLNKFSYFTSSAPRTVVHTDAKGIVFLLAYNFHSSNPKLMRYSMALLSVPNIEIVHCPGKSNTLADALSRQFEEKPPSHLLRPAKLVTKDDIDFTAKSGSRKSLDELVDYVSQHPTCVKTIKSSLSHLSHEADRPSTSPEPNEIFFARVQKLHSLFRFFTVPFLAKQQATDPWCKAKIDSLLKLPGFDDGVFCFANGLLCRRRNKAEDFSPTNSLIVTPQSCQSVVLAYFHAYGHLGALRLSKFVSSYFWFKKLNEACRQFAAGCNICQLHKRHKHGKQETTNMELPSAPNDVWSIDFFSTSSSGGMKEILQVFDDYSGMLWSFPCPSQQSQHVIRALSTLFAFMGVPRMIRSDHGRSLLESRAVSQFCKEWGVQKLSLGIPHLATKNALVERSIQSTRLALKTLSEQYGTKFSDVLPLANHVLNATPHNLEGLTPYEIYTGRKVTISLPQLPARPLPVDQYILDARRRIEAITRKVGLLRNQHRRKYLSLMNKTRKQLHMAEGDLVLLLDLSTPAQGERPKKDRPQYLRSPFLIRKRLTNLVVLQNLLDGRVIQASINDIKPLIARGRIFRDLPASFQAQFGQPFQPFDLLQGPISPSIRRDFERTLPRPSQPTTRARRRNLDAQAAARDEEAASSSDESTWSDDTDDDQDNSTNDTTVSNSAHVPTSTTSATSATSTPPATATTSAPAPPTPSIRDRLRSSRRNIASATRTFFRRNK